MAAHSPNTYSATVPDLRTQLEQEWNENQYAVSVEQAHATLDHCCKDPGLLETCARLKLDVTQVIWDITVASSSRNLVQKLSATRKQAQNTVNKSRRRAPPQTKLDDPTLTLEEFERYVRARFHPRQNTVDRLTGAIHKFSNPPGIEKERHQPVQPGRREDSAGLQLLKTLDARLRAIPGLRYNDRIDLLARILTHFGFLQPRIEGSDVYETVKKKLSRMSASRVHHSHRSK